MNAWIFTAPDTWTLAPDTVPEWSEGEDDTTMMARAGYAYESRARNSDLVNFVGAWTLWYANADHAPYPYALFLDAPGDEGCVFVWLPAFPDLMAYMAKYGHVGQAELDGCDWDAFREAFNRLFRAWHGHAATTFCRECDPMAYENWQKKQKERAARKAAATV